MISQARVVILKQRHKYYRSIIEVTNVRRNLLVYKIFVTQLNININFVHLNIIFIKFYFYSYFIQYVIYNIYFHVIKRAPEKFLCFTMPIKFENH